MRTANEVGADAVARWDRVDRARAEAAAEAARAARATKRRSARRRRADPPGPTVVEGDRERRVLSAMLSGGAYEEAARGAFRRAAWIKLASTSPGDVEASA